MTKKIYISLHGSYFGHNYGDVLLITIFARWIKDKYPHCVINYPLADRIRTIGLPEGEVGLFNFLRSKALIYCGGGYFGERPFGKSSWSKRNFKRHSIIGFVALLLRIPYAFIGVEFGPISNTWFRSVTIFLAKHASVVVVRNKESKIFLEENGVRGVILGADAVLTLSSNDRPKEKKGNILLHIPGFQKNKEKYKELIFQFLSVIKEEKIQNKIIFISDNYNYYFESPDFQQIIDMFKEESVPFEFFYYSGCDSLVNLISESSYVITTKLHVGITSAALNIRPLSFWNHPKTKRFYEQIENSSFCHSIGDTSDFKEIIKNYLAIDEPFSLPAEIRENAILNKVVLYDFIKKQIR